jgi:hypothetical protein
MLCKIWGFHGSDFEECRLLGYQNPVRTSPETLYFSATDLNHLILCKILGFHCGDGEKCRLSWMWHRVVFVSIHFSEKCVFSVVKVKRISGLGITLAVTSNWITLWRIIAVLLVRDNLSDERMRLQVTRTSATGPCQRSQSRPKFRRTYSPVWDWVPFCVGPYG